MRQCQGTKDHLSLKMKASKRGGVIGVFISHIHVASFGSSRRKKKLTLLSFVMVFACVCMCVCVCVCVCARVVSEQLQSVTIGVCPLVHPQLSLVEPRHQVLMLPLFKVWLTPFKK